jgi:cell pole-organizing protein PopZ
MTDQTAQEPTMEEILASIRRIISEDDAPAETAEAAAPAQSGAESDPDPQPEPVGPEAEEESVSPALMDETPSTEEPAASEEDVLELTDTYEAPAAAESIGDLDVSPAAEDVDPFPVEAVSESVFASEPEHPADNTSIDPAPKSYDPLVGDSAAASAASAFAGLASSLRKPEPMETSIPSGPTLDELARALLRPMLKEWLDANLPGIVEAQVRKEVERIARSAG